MADGRSRSARRKPTPMRVQSSAKKILHATRVAAPESMKRLLRVFVTPLRDRQLLPARSLIRPEFFKMISSPSRRHVGMDGPVLGGLVSPKTRSAALFSSHITVGRERYERTAAANGIEARDPYLDLKVIEFCLSLPPEQLVRHGWPKHLVRRTMADELPSAVRWRRPRTHLGISFSRALLNSGRTQILSECTDLVEQLSPYINDERGRRVVQEFSAGAALTEVDIDHLLTILVLGRFLSRHRIGMPTANRERYVESDFTAAETGYPAFAPIFIRA